MSRLCARPGLPAGPLLGLVALVFVVGVLTINTITTDDPGPDSRMRVSSGEDWTALARSLGNGDARGYAAEWEVRFARELDRVVANAGLTAQLQATPHVLYPFSGTDVATLLALQPTAKGYVLASQNPTFPVGPGGGWLGRDSWLHNKTFLEAAKVDAREVIKLSHMGGYQYGHLVRPFAERYGAVTLLLTILGSLSNIEVDLVLPIALSGVVGVMLRCTRVGTPGQLAKEEPSQFWIRYVEVDLHDAGAVGRLEAAMVQRWGMHSICTVLKGAESGLLINTQRAEDFGETVSKKRVAEIMAISRAHNAAVIKLVDTLLRLTDVLVQDRTGIPFQTLVHRWPGINTNPAGSPLKASSHLHTFGVFNDSGVTDTGLGQYFSQSYGTEYAHSFGKVRFGYCVPADALGRLVQDQNAAVIREIYDENESVMAGFVCHLLVGCKHGCTVAPGR